VIRLPRLTIYSRTRATVCCSGIEATGNPCAPRVTHGPSKRLSAELMGAAMSPEVALWNAVILRAIDDAIAPVTSNTRNRDEARAWLTRPNQHFNDVCDLAGHNPKRVRLNALRVIAEADANPQQVVRKKSSRRGVTRKFPKPQGTGARSIAHDSAEIEFLPGSKELEPCL
jgi:hypothetical protein